uniref:Uncharacterized protein n=1 Tax=Leersia perrieri TaxID=77586 RepID=A0A0D9W201_9ORYZ
MGKRQAAGKASKLLEQDNIRLHDREITNLEHQIQTLRMKVQNHETYEDRKRKEYKNLETKYNNLQSKYNNLQANYNNLQTNYNNLEIGHNALKRQMNGGFCC